MRDLFELRAVAPDYLQADHLGATRHGVFLEPTHIAARLLCGDCEQLLNKNGENDVLRWLAPKARQGQSPLYLALAQATPEWSNESEGVKCYTAAVIGLNPETLAYFGLSLLWRASAAEWPLPGGDYSPRLPLDGFAEPIRLFLLGGSPFPEHVHVMVTVCEDERSQEVWGRPERSPEFGGLFMVPIIGLLFRFWLGRVLPPAIDRTIFFPATTNRIYVTHCWDGALALSMSELFPTDAPNHPNK